MTPIKTKEQYIAALDAYDRSVGAVREKRDEIQRNYDDFLRQVYADNIVGRCFKGPKGRYYRIISIPRGFGTHFNTYQLPAITFDGSAPSMIETTDVFTGDLPHDYPGLNYGNQLASKEKLVEIPEEEFVTALRESMERLGNFILQGSVDELGQWFDNV